MIILDTKKWIDEYRGIVFKQLPKDLLIAEHTEKQHFYRYKKTKELFQSVTAPLNVLNLEHLKAWSAGIASQFVIDNWDNEKYSSKEELQRRATQEHYLIFKDAGIVGTRGHEIVEQYCKEWINTGVRPKSITSFVDQFEQDMRVHAIALSAEKYFIESGAIPVFSELNVAVPKLKIAGQLDLILLIPKKGEYKNDYELVLVDIKTSNTTTHDTYALQTSVYFEGFKQLVTLKTDICPLKKIMILGLNKNKPKYELSFVPHIRSSLAIYKKVLEIYRWKDDNKRKKVVTERNNNIIKI